MNFNLNIATFNLENLDDKPGRGPTLDERITVLRPQLIRLKADILCLQEVNGQEEEGQPRRLLALEKLLEGTEYEDFHQVSTVTTGSGQVYDKRNMVILSRYEIEKFGQYKHDFAMAAEYRKIMAVPEEESRKVTWERPILHAEIRVRNRRVHIINLHLKSRLPVRIEGQQISRDTWKTAAGWAEGFFISSMKRVGQAMETRMLLDHLFDKDEQALIAVCGDFNAGSDEVPLEVIRGDVNQTRNFDLVSRVMVPCERAVAESQRFSLYYHGKGRLLDHLLVSRQLMAWFRGAEVHNEMLNDESIGLASEKVFSESDHAPVLASFVLPG